MVASDTGHSEHHIIVHNHPWNAMTSFLNDVRRILVDGGLSSNDSIRGCSAEEIEQVQLSWNLPLSPAYRAFLEVMGRSAGRFLQGTSIFFPDCLSFPISVGELAADDPRIPRLPADAIVFMMHQGYQFMFLCADEGDRSPVLYYLEGTGKFEQKARRFSEWLVNVSYEHVQAFGQHK